MLTLQYGVLTSAAKTSRPAAGWAVNEGVGAPIVSQMLSDPQNRPAATGSRSSFRTLAPGAGRERYLWNVSKCTRHTLSLAQQRSFPAQG